MYFQVHLKQAGKKDTPRHNTVNCNTERNKAPKACRYTQGFYLHKSRTQSKLNHNSKKHFLSECLPDYMVLKVIIKNKNKI